MSRVLTTADFWYAPDGRTREVKVAGEVFEVRDELAPGLAAAGVVEETTRPLTTADELAALRAKAVGRKPPAP